VVIKIEEFTMKIQIKLLLTLLCALSLIACEKGQQAQDKTRQLNPQMDGTVDGGGGDVVVNPKTGTGQLLDLAEAAGKEPFDYDFEAVIIKELGDDPQMKQRGAIQKLRGTSVTSEVMQELADFYGWALTEVMYSNTEKSSEYHNHNIKEMHVDAFNLKGRQVINNLQYGFTDKSLEEINDEGAIVIDNPLTKKQLAVQDGHGNVLISRAEFSRLDLDSKLALKLHESVLYLVLRFNPALIKESGTAPIRQFVRDYFNYAYVSEVKGAPQISLDEVRASFRALKLPKITADYAQIKALSKANAGTVAVCDLTLSEPSRVNYHFSKNGKRITDAFAMNIEFYMKFQLHLVKRGLCVFQPKDCEMKSIKFEHMEGDVLVTTYQWGLTRDGMVLPIQSKQVEVVQNRLLPLYQTAQICK
jgi:hypothetical protein